MQQVQEKVPRTLDKNVGIILRKPAKLFGIPGIFLRKSEELIAKF